MKKQIKLTESDLHNIIKESVKRILKEEQGDVVTQFAELLATDFGMNTATYIAQELARTGQDTINTMEGIINHMNGYGYGGPDVNGNVNY